MAVLYRKYRPQKFADVVGQEAIVRTLRNQISLGSVAHAYLFTGSRGIGKTSIARIFAKAVNCKARHQPGKLDPNDMNSDACGECEVCKQIEMGNFLDLVEIDAASNTGVDNIRELIEHVKFSPSLGKYKIFIIDEVHMLSKGAFNALLKTLEEPPAHAIFILATTEVGKVPLTIISRTQKFDFLKIPSSQILTQLEKVISKESISLSKEVLQIIATQAEGGMRDALSLLDKVASLSGSLTMPDYERILGMTHFSKCAEFGQIVITDECGKASEFIREIMLSGADLKIFTKDFLELLRKALVYKITQNTEGLNLEDAHKHAVVELSGQVSVNWFISAIRLFLKAYKDLDDSPILELPLIIAAVELMLKKESPNTANIGISTNNQKETFKRVEENFGSGAGISKSPSPPEVISVSNLPEVSEKELEVALPKIIEELKKINFPLANLIKNSKFEKAEDGRLVFLVDYAFHKQSMEKQASRTDFAKVSEAVLGRKLTLFAKIIKTQKNQDEPDNGLASALKILGGELAE